MKTSRLLALPAVVALGAVGLTACGGGNAADLDVGDCYNAPSEETEILDVEMKDCSEPHENEVYAKTDLADGDWPGENEVQDQTFNYCIDEFETFIGVPFEDAWDEYDIYALYPTQDSWRQGDRTITCAAYDLSGEVTGSLEGVLAGS